MNKQLYVKLEEGERIKEGDVYYDRIHGEWVGIISLETGPIAGPGWIRPVFVERVTGTESAFPAFDGSGAVGGMTLREHYAGLAMQGLLAHPSRDADAMVPLLAFNAVNIADALIAALNKKEEAV